MNLEKKPFSVYQNPATETARKLKEAELKEKVKNAEIQGVTLGEWMKVRELREIFSRWVGLCGLDATINEKNSSDMYRALGKRDIGLAIKKELEDADPDLYDVMVKEAREAKSLEVKHGS